LTSRGGRRPSTEHDPEAQPDDGADAGANQLTGDQPRRRVLDRVRGCLPEGGTWNLNAECGGRTYSIEPSLVVVQRDRETTVDARVVKTPG